MQTLEELARKQAAARVEMAALTDQERAQCEGIAQRQYPSCWHMMTPGGRDACVLIAYMARRSRIEPASPKPIGGKDGLS